MVIEMVMVESSCHSEGARSTQRDGGGFICYAEELLRLKLRLRSHEAHFENGEKCDGCKI